MQEHSTTVEYRDIPGFPGYRAGGDGTIWSNRGRADAGRWRMLAANRQKNRRYLYVVIRRDGKTTTQRVHFLVLLTFSGPRPQGKFACHGDGNTFNNSSSNLRWGTAKENAQDREAHGTTCRGSRHGRAKLTEAAAASIRARYVPYVVTMRMLGVELGVTEHAVRSVLTNRTWVKQGVRNVSR